MTPARSNAVAAVVLAVGAALRFTALGWLPSPAGDEGTWTLLALRLARGEDAGLPPDAAFVSRLFAWLIAGVFRIAGPSFAAARAVGASASLSAALVAYIALSRLGTRRGALAAATVLALHPWAIAWGRTASVPYALALLTSTAGPLAFLVGVRERRDRWLAVGVLAAGLGAQFTPLALASAVSCAAMVVPRAHRWVLRRAVVWASVALVAVATAPLVLAGVRAVHASPPLGPQPALGASLVSMTHAVLTGLAGEATLRHFTGAALGPTRAWLLAVPVVLVLALAARGGALGRLGVVQFGIALVVAPLLLAGARSWQLETIDADRYLFVWLSPFALCVADVADWKPPARLAVVGALVAMLLVADLRGAAWVTRDGGPDTGLRVFDGGGAYRGWRASRARVAVATELSRAILADARGAPCTVLIADWAFHPLRFALDGTLARVRDVRSRALAHASPARTYAVLWSDAIFAAPTSPRFAADDNDALRTRFARCFAHPARVATIVQPDGRGLVELWRAEALADSVRDGLGCGPAR